MTDAGAATGGRGRRALWLGYAASGVLHAALFVGLVRLPSSALGREEVAVEIVEVAPPAPPVAAPPAPAPEPAPTVRPRRTPPVPRDAPPPPAALPEAPPPPNQTPPKDAKRAPVRIGVSMSSTTSAGGVAAPVGDTMYGELPRTAPRPEDVKPYRAERYVPPTQVTALPKPVRTEIPRDEYPPEALDAGVEGVVVLLLRVDVTGRVREARVVDDPGSGFGPAAVKSALRHFVFEPARRGAEPVETSIRFTVRYETP